MNDSIQPSAKTTDQTPLQSARSDEIAQFCEAMDAIVASKPCDAESSLNALIDFFACRCRNAQQSRALGARLFAALNSEATALITTGIFDEQFGFGRDQDLVRIDVDRQQLAVVPLDVAIRLATLLHAASQPNIGRSHAA